MRNAILILTMTLAKLSFFLESELNASATATAAVTYTIAAIDPLTVSGNPGVLVIDSALGSGLGSATDSTTSYAITTNCSSRILTGAVATNMPSGVTLSVTLEAPTGAVSTGPIDLTTTPSSLVTGISQVAEEGLAITYTLTATLSAAQVTNATNTVTYTMTSGP